MKRRDKQRGFTLVELLVTLVIIGIIATIAIAGVQKLLGTGREKYYNGLRSMIISSAKEYFTNNKKLLPVEVDDSESVTLETLESEEYIEDVKDANGDACDIKNSTVTVFKESANKYEYYLNLSCPDPKMKEVEEGANQGNLNPDITFSSNGDKKNITVQMCVNGRKDYTYELLKKGSSSEQYKVIKNRKGNIKTSSNCINIDLDQGSGIYKIRGRSGNTIKESYCTGEDYCESGSGSGDSGKKLGGYVIQEDYPSCEGISYQVNKVANTYFSGDLIINVTTNDKDKYHVDHFNIEYGSNKSKTFYGQGSETFAKLTEKNEARIRIYNSVGDEEVCSLGDYYADNTAPQCTNKVENKTWTNSKSAFVSVDCDDNGSECKESHIVDREDGEYSDIVIEDLAGNQTTCRVTKRIDREKPSCQFKQEYTTWGANHNMEMTCLDSVSGCKQTKYTDNSEGKYSQFDVSDKAGNTAHCQANKYKDSTPPQCVNFSTTYDYVEENPNDPVNTKYKKQGTTTGLCKDTGSGCVEDEIIHFFDGDQENGQVRIYDESGLSTLCPETPTKAADIPSCPSASTGTLWLENAQEGFWTNGKGPNGADYPISFTIAKSSSNDWDYVLWPEGEGTVSTAGATRTSSGIKITSDRVTINYNQDGEYGQRGTYYTLCKDGNCQRKCQVPNIKLDTESPKITARYTVARSSSTYCPKVVNDQVNPSFNFTLDFRDISASDGTAGSGISYYQIEEAPIFHVNPIENPNQNDMNWKVRFYQPVKPRVTCPQFDMAEQQYIYCKVQDLSEPSYNLAIQKLSDSNNLTFNTQNFANRHVQHCMDWAIVIRVYDQAGNPGTFGACGNPSLQNAFSNNCIGLFNDGPFND